MAVEPCLPLTSGNVWQVRFWFPSWKSQASANRGHEAGEAQILPEHARQIVLRICCASKCAELPKTKQAGFLYWFTTSLSLHNNMVWFCYGILKSHGNVVQLCVLAMLGDLFFLCSMQLKQFLGRCNCYLGKAYPLKTHCQNPSEPSQPLLLAVLQFLVWRPGLSVFSSF